jgi:hypothetical protein
MLWTPDMENEEVESQLSIMVDRAVATNAWLGGEMPTSDFLDLLHYQGIDVYDLSEGWDAGLIYL